MKRGKTYTYVTAADGKTRKRTLAHKTCSPHFAITPLMYLTEKGKPEWDKRWMAVTHIPTGAAALKPFTSVRKAQLAAAVLAGCPIDWGKVTVRTLMTRWRKLPNAIQLWRIQLANELAIEHFERTARI